MKIKKNIQSYLEKNINSPEKVEKFASFVEDFFKDMDEDKEYIIHQFEDDLEEITDEIDENMLKIIIENLRKRDGSHSEIKWTHDETSVLCSQYGVADKLKSLGKEYDKTKFWFAMNYVYATHYSSNRLNSGYVELAIDELCNKNIRFDDIIKKIFKKM